MQASSSSSLLPPSVIHPERKKDEPFLSSSRGDLCLRFTLAGVTIQDPFWNVLGNNLSSKNLEQEYSKHRGGSSIPGSQTDSTRITMLRESTKIMLRVSKHNENLVLVLMNLYKL